MISAQALRELMELGLEGERLLAVVTVFERDGERNAQSNVTRNEDRDVLVTRTLTGAERAARHRAKRLVKDAADGAAPRNEARNESNVTGVTKRDADLVSSFSKSSYVSENKEEKETKKEKRVTRASNERNVTAVTESDAAATRRKRAGPLPGDWSPSAVHFDAAHKLGRGSDFVLDKAEDMRLWAQANGASKVDWNATFHGFIRRDAGKVKGHGQQSNGFKRKSLSDAADDLIARSEGGGREITLDVSDYAYGGAPSGQGFGG